MIPGGIKHSRLIKWLTIIPYPQSYCITLDLRAISTKRTGCKLSALFPAKVGTLENLKKSWAIPAEKCVFVPVKEHSEKDSVDSSPVTSKMPDASIRSKGKFSMEEVMSTMKGKPKVKSENKALVIEEHLPVTCDAGKKKRKIEDVVITKVVEANKPESTSEEGKVKTWEEFIKKVQGQGSQFVEELIAKGKEMELEYQVKAFTLEHDKMKIEKSMDVVKQELYAVKLERNRLKVEVTNLKDEFCNDLLKAQKQVASLTQELVYLNLNLAEREVSRAKAIEAVRRQAINTTGKLVLEAKMKMMKEHAAGEHTEWDMEEIQVMLDAYERDDGEVTSNPTAEEGGENLGEVSPKNNDA